MEIFIKIFYGILLFISGAALIKYRKVVYEWTGKFGWAERYIGNGGTVIVLTLFGLFLIFASIAYPAGVFEMPKAQNSFDTLDSQYGDTQNTNNANTGTK